MPRKYTKKSNYWNKFQNKTTEISEAQESVEPATMGPAYHISEGSYERGGFRGGTQPGATTNRINRSAIQNPVNKFSQIRGGLLPFELAGDGINVRDAIELCQKAYANVPIFRNTIDMMSEFANTEVYLEGGNTNSREFFSKLFDKICFCCIIRN